MYADHTGDKFLQSHDQCVKNHIAEPTNQPVSKGYGHTIHKSAEENYYVGKSSKILCMKTKNGKESLCVRMHSNGGDANCKCVSIFSQSWGEWKNVCVSDEQQKW